MGDWASGLSVRLSLSRGYMMIGWSESLGCVTLQGGKCNFNLWTLGILNLLALGALGPGLDFGIWELAKAYSEFARSTGGRNWQG